MPAVRLRLWTGFIGCALAVLLAGPLVDRAAAEAPPPVELSAEHTTVRVTEPIHLTATTTTDVGPTPYSIRIFDSESHVEVQRCGSGKKCEVEIPIEWSENESPKDRHYYAEVSASGGGEHTTSGEVAVTVNHYVFEVSLTSNHSSVQVEEGFTLKAKADKDVGPTPYRLNIIENGTGTQVASCGSGSTCEVTITPAWSENDKVHVHSYHAVVASSTYSSGESSALAVPVFPFYFAVDLSLVFSHTDGSGTKWYVATATTNRNVGPTPYSIKIRQDGSTVVGSCGSGTECVVEVEGGHSYGAAVEDSEGHAFGSSTISDLPASGLAALFASPGAVCDALLGYPGTHLAGSTPSDQYLACSVAAGLAGATVASTIAAIQGTDGGGKAIWWLLHEGTAAQEGFELPSPSEADPYPVPTALPEVWPVKAVAEDLITANPTAELTESQAETIATRCLWDMALADEDGASLCKDRPIFLSGSDVPSATLHDLKAIATNPSWVNLNYENKATKEEKVEQKWYIGLGGCSGAVPEGKSCDEYPFFSSRQGGPPGASLEYITASDNAGQGGKYGNFVTSCKMVERGPDYEFLAIPLPPTLEIPTTRLCN